MPGHRCQSGFFLLALTWFDSRKRPNPVCRGQTEQLPNVDDVNITLSLPYACLLVSCLLHSQLHPLPPSCGCHEWIKAVSVSGEMKKARSLCENLCMRGTSHRGSAARSPSTADPCRRIQCFYEVR